VYVHHPSGFILKQLISMKGSAYFMLVRIRQVTFTWSSLYNSWHIYPTPVASDTRYCNLDVMKYGSNNLIRYSVAL
jgi:hypothetical protein